jgi:hypothetical protein
LQFVASIRFVCLRWESGYVDFLLSYFDFGVGLVFTVSLRMELQISIYFSSCCLFIEEATFSLYFCVGIIMSTFCYHILTLVSV